MAESVEPRAAVGTHRKLGWEPMAAWMSRLFRARWQVYLRPVLLAAVVISAFFVGDVCIIFAHQVFSHQNRMLRASKSISSYTPILPQFDPVFTKPLLSAENLAFSFVGRHSPSNTIERLKSQSLKSSDLLNTNDYENLWHLLAHLYFQQRYDDEYQAINSWQSLTKPIVAISPYENEDESYEDYYRGLDLVGLIWYLEYWWLEPVPTLIQNSEFDRARYRAHQAAIRMKLFYAGLPPSPGMGQVEQAHINRIYLTDALLSDPLASFSHPDELQLLYGILAKDFPEDQEAALDALSVSPSFAPLWQYWRGIYAFRRFDYKNAFALFKAVATSNAPPDVRELAIFMQARCQFWSVMRPIVMANEGDASDTDQQWDPSADPSAKPDESAFEQVVQSLATNAGGSAPEIAAAMNFIEASTKQVKARNLRSDLRVYLTRLKDVLKSK